MWLLRRSAQGNHAMYTLTSLTQHWDAIKCAPPRLAPNPACLCDASKPLPSKC